MSEPPHFSLGLWQGQASLFPLSPLPIPLTDTDTVFFQVHLFLGSELLEHSLHSFHLPSFSLLAGFCSFLLSLFPAVLLE